MYNLCNIEVGELHVWDEELLVYIRNTAFLKGNV